jgi:hypothetical protein
VVKRAVSWSVIAKQPPTTRSTIYRTWPSCSFTGFASRWKAVLLIDEADIFMGEQSSEHLQLNTLVSVFLRQLEQYDGVLFLTTNRLQAFDEVVTSRIHAAHINLSWLLLFALLFLRLQVRHPVYPRIA